jgi:recombination protein RecA
MQLAPPDQRPDDALRQLLSSGALVRGTQLTLPPRAWTYAALAGTLVELQLGDGALTLAARLTHNAQEAREACIWVREPENGVYPPDLAACGVDLDALVFLRIAEFADMAQAAEQLLHSGAIGLVVIEVAARALVLLLVAHPLPAAQAACCGVRSAVEGNLRSSQDGIFERRLKLLKDRRYGEWAHKEHCHGPDGLC